MFESELHAGLQLRDIEDLYREDFDTLLGRYYSLDDIKSDGEFVIVDVTWRPRN